jgi:hypothetical protein
MAKSDPDYVALLGEVEILDASLDTFFAGRYPDTSLAKIGARSLVEHERWMANAMLGVRVKLHWPKPTIVGEERCIVCHRIMGDDLSAVEDETVCAECVGDVGE